MSVGGGDEGRQEEPFAAMIRFLEVNVLNQRQMDRERMVELLKKLEGKWEFSELYEAVEEVKWGERVIWKFSEKTLQKLGTTKSHRKKFQHVQRKLLVEKLIKIDKVNEDIGKLKGEEDWVQKHAAKALDRIRRKMKAIEKVEIKLENERKKEQKYEEVKRKERAKREKQREKLREKREKELEKQKKEIERQREKDEKKRQKEMKKKKREMERERREREKAEQQRKSKLLAKKNSSMMDFFNQSKPPLKRVKTQAGDTHARCQSLGQRRGFGQVDQDAVSKLDLAFTGKLEFNRQELVARFKSKRVQRASMGPKERILFNRFEDYLGTCVERTGRYSKRSAKVTGRHPLERDSELLNYEMDTEDEIQELEAESCKSIETGDEDMQIVDEDEEGGFIVKDDSNEPEKRQPARGQHLQQKLVDLRSRRNLELEAKGWMRVEAGQMMRGESVIDFASDRDKLLRDFEGIRMHPDKGRINFGFLRRKEIEKKRLEMEKERRKLERKNEAEKIKQKPKLTVAEKLKWVKEVFGGQSKKELIAGGLKVTENFRATELENLKQNWEMVYFADVRKFEQILGKSEGAKLYFDCLMKKQNKLVLERLKKKQIPKKPEAKKSSSSDLISLFKQMEQTVSSREATPRKSKTKSAKKSAKKKAMQLKQDKRSMKKDPENLRRLEEMILILGNGSCKRHFDLHILKAIKQKFGYFSERMILQRVKELLRYGYLASRQMVFELLSGHENEYLQSERENSSKKDGGIGSLLQGKTAQTMPAVSKRIVEDFFFGERLHLKLQKVFEN